MTSSAEQNITLAVVLQQSSNNLERKEDWYSNVTNILGFFYKKKANYYDDSKVRMVQQSTT